MYKHAPRGSRGSQVQWLLLFYLPNWYLAIVRRHWSFIEPEPEQLMARLHLISVFWIQTYEFCDSFSILKNYVNIWHCHFHSPKRIKLIWLPVLFVLRLLIYLYCNNKLTNTAVMSQSLCNLGVVKNMHFTWCLVLDSFQNDSKITDKHNVILIPQTQYVWTMWTTHLCIFRKCICIF